MPGRPLDPRSSPSLSPGAEGGLARLSAIGNTDFPNLVRARSKTERRLGDIRQRCEDMELDDDVALVLMGSWGRRELTRESDVDFIVLVHGAQNFRRRRLTPSLETVRDLLGEFGKPAGREGTFGTYVYSDQLAGRIGLDQDDNANLTRRLLLMLESVPVAGDENWRMAREVVLDEYLDGALKDRRPPRLFLNDIVRYWRTICVDFAGKQRQRQGEGWGLRNAKLRLTRKGLFASGLLPALRCQEVRADSIKSVLADQLAAVPVDRLADAFTHYGKADAGARALQAYDNFLAVLDDESNRHELDTLQQDDLVKSRLFRDVRSLGERFQDALLVLLFESELAAVAREYAIF